MAYLPRRDGPAGFYNELLTLKIYDYERSIENLREGHSEGWLHGYRDANFRHHRTWFIRCTFGALESDSDMGMQMINF